MTPEEAYEEIVRLGREYALIYQSIAGIVLIVHPERQKLEQAIRNRKLSLNLN